MPPREHDNYFSSLGLKHSPSRENYPKNADLWLEDKKKFDGAEGLWRVHNGLYDLTNFVDKHPGGKFWIETTKGTDFTEAFESHHISTKPEEILKKYFVRKAKTTRHSPFTFEEDGFYRTLKRNVREALKTIPREGVGKTKMFIDSSLLLAFIFSVLACYFWSFKLGLVAGAFLCFTTSIAHNYYHKKDNFRLYYNDIVMVHSREWRIFHVLSHHSYCNTVSDFQTYMSEPMQMFFPHRKSLIYKFVSVILTLILYWPTAFHLLFCSRVFYYKNARKTDLLTMVLPLTMYLFSGQSLLMSFAMWSFCIAVSAFLFNLLAFATTHYHPELFMDGDKPRSAHELDWGILQTDTCSEKFEVMDNLFLTLITLGDHVLHHLFPTFDHGILPHLYPVLEETMKQFNLTLKKKTLADLVIGYFRLMIKETPNENIPN